MIYLWMVLDSQIHVLYMYKVCDNQELPVESLDLKPRWIARMRIKDNKCNTFDE